MNVITVVEHPVDPRLTTVHAAVADPDVPGAAGPVTACGLATRGMVTDPWRPVRPEDRWYPPELLERLCPLCDRAVRLA
ncbi:hypothetical protein ACWGB8_04825 [Kitasatospora sp. NPDC054939]